MDVTVVPEMPFLFSEAWFNWVWEYFRTALIVLGAVGTAIASATRSTVDDKIWDAVKKAMPWSKQ